MEDKFDQIEITHDSPTADDSPDAVLARQQHQLIESASKGDLDRMKELLALGTLDVNYADGREKNVTFTRLTLTNATALLRAVANNQPVDVIRVLIEAGANVNATEEYNGWTPLVLATYYNNLEIVKFLIESGADVNEKTKAGHTALWWAKEDNFEEIADFLAERGGIFE